MTPFQLFFSKLSENPKKFDIGSTEFKIWQPKESPNHSGGLCVSSGAVIRIIRGGSYVSLGGLCVSSGGHAYHYLCVLCEVLPIVIMELVHELYTQLSKVS